MKKYKYNIRCDYCGRFTKFEQFCKGGGGSVCEVPDSEYSYEEIVYRCKKCTDNFGTVVSSQMGINSEYCSKVC